MDEYAKKAEQIAAEIAADLLMVADDGEPCDWISDLCDRMAVAILDGQVRHVLVAGSAP
jgi:hypothetical protein